MAFLSPLLFTIVSLFVPSFLLLLAGAFLIGKITRSAHIFSIKRILLSIGIALGLEGIIALALTLSAHSGSGYYVCTIDICQVQSFWDAFGNEIGGIWFINILTLTAPTFIVALIAYIVLASGAVTRARVSRFEN